MNTKIYLVKSALIMLFSFLTFSSFSAIKNPHFVLEPASGSTTNNFKGGQTISFKVQNNEESTTCVSWYNTEMQVLITTSSSFPSSIPVASYVLDVFPSTVGCNGCNNNTNIALPELYLWAFTRNSGEKGSHHTFSFTLPKCVIQPKLYIYVRYGEKRNGFVCGGEQKFSSWITRGIDLELGTVNIGANPQPEIKCGDVPFEGISPTFFTTKMSAQEINVNTLSPKILTNNKEIRWDYQPQFAAPRYAGSTYGDQRFGPESISEFTSDQKKESRMLRYTVVDDCIGSVDLANNKLPNGVALFYRISNPAQYLPAMPERYLINTQNMPCSQEMECRIRDLNYTVLPSSQEMFKLFKEYSGINATDVANFDHKDTKYFYVAPNGTTTQNAFMDLSNNNLTARVCYSHLQEDSGVVSRKYRIEYTYIGVVNLGLNEYVDGGARQFTVECTFSVDITVSPRVSVIGNPVLTAAKNAFDLLYNQVLAFVGPNGDPCPIIGTFIPTLEAAFEDLLAPSGGGGGTLPNGNDLVTMIDRCVEKNPVMLPFKDVDPSIPGLFIVPFEVDDLSFRWINNGQIVSTDFNYLYPNTDPINFVNSLKLEYSLDGIVYFPYHEVLVFNSCEPNINNSRISQEINEMMEMRGSDEPLIVNIEISGVDLNTIEKSDQFILRKTSSNGREKSMLFPNPNNGNFTVKLPSNISESLSKEVIISDAIGKILYRNTLSVEELNNGYMEFNNTLTPGEYLIQINFDESRETLRFQVK
ncbi:MAG: T9SS type A sorting domain-containing protein [Bacteroidetes bacterium]|nr:T9SS type A sorting domain-containing protein [Bacteroidota bacterium]